LKKLWIRFLIVPRPKTAVPKVKRAQTAACDRKKRRPTRISEGEIDLEPAAEREAEIAVGLLAARLRRLTPIVSPDQDLHVQLTTERHPRIADTQFSLCKHELLAILNLALFHGRPPTPRDDGTIDRRGCTFLAGRFGDARKSRPRPRSEIVVNPEYRFRERSPAGLLDEGRSVAVSTAICGLTGIVEHREYEADANPGMNDARRALEHCLQM
jgi:hypothetical protein